MYFEDIINEIERNLLTDIDIEKLAKKANLSVYEFRRVFSFVAKISPGEYIRKRRLSLAAVDIHNGERNITYLSGKYGYDSPSSFARAFKSFHGISPTDVMKGNSSFKMLTKVVAEIIKYGGDELSYKIIRKPAFYVSGFIGISTMEDSECCENIWEMFYRQEYADEICCSSDKIYAIYDNGKDFVRCCIGKEGVEYPDRMLISETEWLCFILNTTDDEYVNTFYNNILNCYFDSSVFERDTNLPNIEVFPADMSKDNFEWEIWIPIKKKR